MITPKNVVRHELIGLGAVVSKAKDTKVEGLRGTIVEETLKTLVLNTDGKRKRLVKENITIELNVGEKTVSVDGRLLVGRPEDRIKKKLPKRWSVM